MIPLRVAFFAPTIVLTPVGAPQAPCSAPQARAKFWPGGLILTILARKVRSKFVPATPQVLLQRETPTLAHSFCARPLGFSCCLLLLAMARLVRGTWQQQCSRAFSSLDSSAAARTSLHDAFAMRS